MADIFHPDEHKYSKLKGGKIQIWIHIFKYSTNESNRFQLTAFDKG